MVGAFKTLLSKEGDWRPSIDAMSFEILDDQEARKLEEIFTEEEVFGALSELNGDKAPARTAFLWPRWPFYGSDGFSIAFWQFNWKFVKTKC